MSRPRVRAAALAAAWAAVACGRGETPRQAPAAGAPPAAAPAPAVTLADSGAAPATTVDLPRSYLFRPETVTVRPGARVAWTNHDVFTHGVKFDSGAVQLTLRPGAQGAYLFTRPGTFAYVCPFHPQMMKGVVVVAAGR